MLLNWVLSAFILYFWFGGFFSFLKVGVFGFLSLAGFFPASERDK